MPYAKLKKNRLAILAPISINVMMAPRNAVLPQLLTWYFTRWAPLART